VNPATGAPGGVITAKASAPADVSCNLARPYGVDAEIFALNAGQQDAAQVAGQPAYCVDFVFADRGPNMNGFRDAFAALASDAIAWSHPTLSGVTSPQPAALTRAELVSIYTCVDTNWDQVGGANAPIVPALPSVGTGTRDTFLKDLGIAVNNEPCWVNGTAPNGAPIEEDTGLSSGNSNTFTQAGNVFDGDTASSADIIFPYSIGDWIAQGPAVHGTGPAGTPGGATVGGHASAFWGHGNLALGETVDPFGTAQAPASTNSFGQPVINPNFSSQFFLTLWDVVRNGFTNPTSAANAAWPVTPSYEATGLKALFGPQGYACTNATALSDEVSYGFATIGSNCGALIAGD
jgi:hypothetical protein